MVDGKAQVTGNESQDCGHCMAVCPESAIRVAAIDPESLHFNAFSLKNAWIPFGGIDPALVAALLASRRSCRNFKQHVVPRQVLRDLIKLGTLAPSGTNSQSWTFTVLPDRDRVLDFGRKIAAFYRRLNTSARKTWLRALLRIAGKPELDDYYRSYYESVKQALEEFETDGIDRLFHGATAVILVGSRPDASCPAEDALLASGNILIGAHALGLGSCLIGFAVTAMKHDPTLFDTLTIPRTETVHAAIALGYPAETYLRLTGRKNPAIRFV